MWDFMKIHGNETQNIKLVEKQLSWKNQQFSPNTDNDQQKSVESLHFSAIAVW